MKVVTWQDSYRIDLPEIDEQHKVLFGLINQLWGEIAHCKLHESQMKLIEQLELYTISHFTQEETFMREIEYPAFDEHKALHEQFIQRISREKDSLLEGNKLSLDILRFLKNWLVNHILVEDRKYARFFDKKFESTPSPPSIFKRLFKSLPNR